MLIKCCFWLQGWLPSPLLSIHIKNIHKGKHGSDSESYDTEGRYVRLTQDLSTGRQQMLYCANPATEFLTSSYFSQSCTGLIHQSSMLYLASMVERIRMLWQNRSWTRCLRETATCMISLAGKTVVEWAMFLSNNSIYNLSKHRDDFVLMFYVWSHPYRVTAAGEWLLLYSVAKDKDGLLQRETVRGAFDGSLFERLQDNKKSSWIRQRIVPLSRRADSTKLELRH
jgi:hypothetical protein